jgi:hypothetical protein
VSCNLRGADHMPYAAICHSIAVASCHGAPEPSGTCVCEVLPVCHDRPCMPNSEGGCFRSFHRHCLGLTKLPEGAFVCDACQTGVETCLGCRQLGDVSEMQRCTHPACGKTFHRQCARELPRAAGAPQSARPPARVRIYLVVALGAASPPSVARICTCIVVADGDTKAASFVCPRHRCANSQLPAIKGAPLLTCARCPIAYHEGFVPAGCLRHASGSMILCPKHFDASAGQKPPTVLACVVCEGGGDLTCCDTCPACYHVDCIRGKQGFVAVPEGEEAIWRCPDCVNGTKATAGDVVWAKLGKHRWWPAICRNKDAWPESLSDAEPPLPGEFALQFTGTDEWAWTSHANVVKWESGDQRSRFAKGSAKPEFRQALEEAATAYTAKSAADDAAKASLNTRLYANAKPPPYRKIRTNLFTFDRPWLKAEREKIAPCMCTPEEGCVENCLNRMILTECDPKTCPAGKNCQNNRFQTRKGPKVCPLPTPGRGFGLQTKETICDGDFVIEYCGEVVTAEECGRRMDADGKGGEGAFYMLALTGDEIIDARPAANFARFANHSCDPNMVMRKWNVVGQTRAGLFACKPIAAGDELTWNYQLDSFEGHAKMECKCGSSNCSGWIGLAPAKTGGSSSSSTTNKKAKKRKRKKV